MTKLCSLNQENRPFLASEHHADLAQVNYCPGFIETLQFEPTRLAHWIIMSEVTYWKSTINFSKSLRELMSWKLFCRRPSEELPQEHIDKVVVCVDWLHGCGS